MKVLLVTFTFPPYGGVGVLRALSLAKYLPEAEIEVQVLTARNAPAVNLDPTLAKQVPANVTIHRTWTLDLPFKVRKFIKRIVARNHQPQKVAPANGSLKSKRSLPARILGNLLLPDPQIGWIPFAFAAAKKIIRKQKIDAVLITVPPFSALRLCSKLRNVFPDLPIVIDFRDEWLESTIELVSFNQNKRAKQIAMSTEAMAVHSSTAVVAVTQAAQAALQRRYPKELAAKFHHIPNGFDRAVRKDAVRNVDQLRPVVMTFIGTVYPSSHPGTLVQAIAQMPSSMRKRLKLRFIGHIEDPISRALLQSLEDVVELHGFLPQSEALQAAEETDYVFLISHDAINVAAKFYDYLASGKPILAAVRPDGEIRQLLEKTNAGWWADSSNASEIVEMLTAAIERAPVLASSFAPALGVIEQYHRRNLARTYTTLLQSFQDSAAKDRNIA